MILYLTRHGETDNNAAGLVQGRGLDPDLNDVGRAQSEAIARALRDVSLDAVYTSTQRRSQQTAAPSVAEHARARLVVRDGLDEMDWGAHEGKGFTGGTDPETEAAYTELNRRWDAGDTYVQVEGGESPDEVWARVRPVLVEMGEAYPEGHVLVVSHRRLLRVLLAGVLPGGGLERMKDYPHPNAALTTLDVPHGEIGLDRLPRSGGVRLASLADTSFLEGARP